MPPSPICSRCSPPWWLRSRSRRRCPSCSCRARRSEQANRRSSGGSSIATRALWRGSFADRSWRGSQLVRLLVAGVASAPFLGSSRAAVVQGEPGADPLGSAARHVAPRDEPGHRSDRPRAACASGREQGRRPRRAGADGGSDRRHQLRRALGHHRSWRRLRRDRRLHQERHGRLSRALEPRRGVLEREGRGAADGDERATTSSSASTARNWPSSRARPKRCGRRSLESTASRHARVARQTAEPTIEVEVELDAADKYGIKPGDVRRAASTLLSGTRRRQPVRGAAGVRRRRLGHARHPERHSPRSAGS